MRALGLVLALLLVPATVFADLRVSILEGTTEVKAFSKPAPAGSQTFQRLLSCPAPCSEVIGSFLFEDVVPLVSNLGSRVLKTDGSSIDKLELKGVRVTSLVANKVLRIHFDTVAGDLNSLPGGTYPYTAVMTGSFTGPNGIGAASACTDPSETFCVRLTLIANGNTVNLAGSETQATVTVSSTNASATTGIFPSGLSDTENVTCGTVGVANTCQPSLSGRLVARFNRAGEVLTLPGSAVNGGGRRQTQDEGEVDLCIGLRDEVACGDRFLSFTAATERAQSTLQPPLANSTGHNVSNSSTLPFAFDLRMPGAVVPAQNLPLVAIGTGPETASPVDQVIDDRGFLAFAPQQLKLKDLATIIYTYRVVADGGFVAPSDDSLRVEIALTESNGTPIPGVARVRLGSPLDLLSGYALPSGVGVQSGVNLAAEDREERVDTSGLGGECCVTFKKFKTQFGGQGRLVRSITLVLETETGVDQKVEVQSARVQTTSFVPTVATSYQPICDHPVDGLSIRVRKVEGTTNVGGEIIIDDTEIPFESNGCLLRAHVPIGTLLPDVDGSRYKAWLQLNGRSLQPGGTFVLK